MGKQVRIRDGRYELLEVAGRGGMAVVWRARQHGDVGFTRTVAVKQMHDHLTESQLYIDMFAEEARVCATMQNPNMAQVYDFVCEDGEYYLTMEWIDGIDLGSLIRHFSEQGRPMPWEICAAIGVGVLRALADVHEREDEEGNPCPVLHRDISPHNILITTRGMVKLIDFGLCLAADRKTETTEPGVVKGKMSYLSPEVVQGLVPTTQSDQFSVGSVLWESLAGRKLFDGDTDFDVYAKIRDGQIAPIRPIRRDLPRLMISVLQKSLAADPANRYPSVRVMGRELSAVLKTARTAKDLHGLIGKSVCDARAHLDMGERTGESNLTPIAIDSVGIPNAGKRSRADTAPIVLPEQTKATTVPEPRKGLLHRLPFWGKKK
ncbi:MAG: serine/threonine protein kinase [Kofleriaceae bacterium]|nr:serine/threonine protein kinase [Kofleriaceae bacterium]